MSLDDSWQRIVSTALIGTARQPFTVPTATGKLGQLLEQLHHQSSEAALLTTVAILSLRQRTGWLPETYPVSIQEPCDREDLPRCDPRAAQLLQQMLQGQHVRALPEWLAIATKVGQRAPELCLSELLDLGKQQHKLQTAILPVLGQRGRWLAMQNPDWSYAVSVATEEDWETGSPAARLLYLQNLRLQDPDRAKKLLEATWGQELAGDRVKFLEALRPGLSMADEPLLEKGLSNHSKDVRQIAAELLTNLPNSRFCQQITAHITRYLTLTRKPKPTLHITLPVTLNTSLIQCGIERALPRQVAAKVGEKAWWLLQLIGSTPLVVWDQWGMTPTEIIRCARDHKWEAVLLDGWALAAKRQRNFVWSDALLNVWMSGGESDRTVALPELSLEALWDVLSPDRQDSLLISFLESGRGAIHDPLTIRLLCQSRHEWSLDLARLVLDCLQACFSRSNNSNPLAWGSRTAIKEFACLMPISLLPEALKLQTVTDDACWKGRAEDFLALLQFRQRVAQTFEFTDGE